MVCDINGAASFPGITQILYIVLEVFGFKVVRNSHGFLLKNRERNAHWKSGYISHFLLQLNLCNAL